MNLDDVNSLLILRGKCQPFHSKKFKAAEEAVATKKAESKRYGKTAGKRSIIVALPLH